MLLAHCSPNQSIHEPIPHNTGSAAIHGLRGKKNVQVFILYPKGRVSEVQERQMTSVLDRNVHCVGVEGGTFDDCQEIVKECFQVGR